MNEIKPASMMPPPPPISQRRHRLHIDKAIEQLNANMIASVDTGATSQSYKFNTTEKVEINFYLKFLRKKINKKEDL